VGEVSVLLRHRLGAGAWSAWSVLEQGDTEPDPSHPGLRDGTDLAWTGRSDAVEVQVAVGARKQPRDVRLTLVDPGRAPADAIALLDPPADTPAPSAPALPTAGPGSSPPVTSAPGAAGAVGSAAGRPVIYTRAQWGADPRLMGWTPDYAPTIRAGFLHHTVNSNSYRPGDVPAVLRAIYAYHSRTRGWGDIGYNFVVDRFGRIWEGRYGGVDSTVIGGHTGGFNDQTFGVSMLGTYSTAAVPAAVVDALARLFAWKLAAHYRSPAGLTRLTSTGGGTSRYPPGAVVTKPVISGHRDVGRTECPGDRGYAVLPALRAKVAAVMGTGLLDPVTSPRVVDHRAAAGPRTTASLWRASAWTVTVSADCSAAVLRRYAGTGSRVDVRWDLTDGAGRRVRPGGYRVTVEASAGGRSAVPFAGRVTVTAPASAPAPPAGGLPAAGPAGYQPITPVRVLDTRGRLGGGTGLPLSAGSRVDVPVLGVGAIPTAGVAAVALSVGGLCPAGATGAAGANWVLAWPAGTSPPAGAVLPLGSVATGAPTVVGVGAGGRISVAVLRPLADVVVEVVGYLPLAGGAGYHPVPPRRVLDTAAAPLEPGATRLVDVLAASGGAVPAQARAVSVNLHVAAPRGAGVLRLWPAGQPRPAGAALRYVPGWTQSARVLPALSPAGALWLRNDGPTAERVFLELGGWFGPEVPGTAAGTGFTAVPRTRVADIRVGPRATGTVAVTGVAGAPAGATGAVLQVTARADTRTYLTVFGAGPRPPVQDVDLLASGWYTNLVLAPVRPDGSVSVANGYGTAQVVVDVLGYLAGPG
jgi:hypothetical protein